MSVRIDCDDCRNWIPQQSNAYQMAFADPPFNIGHKYAEFEDKLAESELYSFTNRWVVPLWETLDAGGVMLIYHPVEMQRFVWSTLNIYGISKYHENTVIAHFNFGQYRDTDFINAHCQCVVIRKPGERKFYPDNIRIPSERLKMGDRRVLKAKNKGMRVPGNVIESPRVQGNNSERWDVAHGALVDHPNQLPLSFLKTLVSAYTREGDSVIEPFAGSGGLGLVCDRMNRNYAGCELGEKTAESARKRVREGYWS